jgi:hypothetical protein
MTRANTFIKAAEVWIPSEDGSILEFGSGAFGPARAFAALSRSMCFGRGEGLPGRTWDEGCPVLLSSFDPVHFRRTAAAKAVGLTCTVSLPYFASGKLKAVLVIFCGHEPEESSALELWQSGPTGTEMSLLDGAYGEHGTIFAGVSRSTTFARGSGLPGRAWSSGVSQFVEELGSASAPFLRKGAAGDAGLVRGLAIPAESTNGRAHVVTLLAGAALPLAHRVEIWSAGPGMDHLRRSYAFSELHGGVSKAEASLPLSRNEPAHQGSIARAWLNGTPEISDYPASEPGAAAAAASRIGAQAIVAIPVMRANEVAEVLALYL